MKSVVLGAIAAAFVIAAPAFAETPAESAAAKVVSKNFANWETALKSGEPKKVAALFATTGVLQPTVSNKIADTPGELEAYFVDFLKLSPRPTVNERYVRAIDEDTVLDAGIWTFDLTRDGKAEWVTARYSFIWEKDDSDAWKIQLLHSSQMPQPVAARPAALN